MAVGGLLFLSMAGAFAGQYYGEARANTSVNVDISVTIDDVLSLTVDGATTSDVEINYGATEIGNFKHQPSTVIAATNNGTGYTLTFNDADNNNDLLHEVNVSYKIASVASPMVATDFLDNTWGFALGTVTSSENLVGEPVTSGIDTASGGTLTYRPVPKLSAPLELDKTTKPGERSYPVDYGVKTSRDIPGGTYSDQTTFTLVANYVPVVPAFFKAKTMQAFTQDTCDTVDTPAAAAATIVTSASEYNDPTTQVPQVTLKDARDNKYYIVRKLADGNCWMAQNLDLEVGGMTLTSEDTDLNSKTSWDGAIQVAAGASWNAYDYDNAYYYGPKTTQTGDDYYTNGQSLTTWTGEFPSNLEPTPSYLAGNYYTWAAATAGSVDSSYSGTSKEAPDSICPKGWKLPSAAGAKSWTGLVTTAYGVPNSAAGSTAILRAPISFVRAGYYHYAGYMDQRGAWARFWSATARAATGGEAHAACTNLDSVSPQNVNGAYVGYGFNVRCVAR